MDKSRGGCDAELPLFERPPLGCSIYQRARIIVVSINTSGTGMDLWYDARYGPKLIPHLGGRV